MRPVDVISEALHRQTLCDDAPGCTVIHDTEAEQIAAALRRAGWRFVDAETLAAALYLNPVVPSSPGVCACCGADAGEGMRDNAARLIAALDGEVTS